MSSKTEKLFQRICAFNKKGTAGEVLVLDDVDPATAEDLDIGLMHQERRRIRFSYDSLLHTFTLRIPDLRYEIIGDWFDNMQMKWILAGICPAALFSIVKGRAAIVRGFAAPYENSAKEPDYQIRGEDCNTIPSLSLDQLRTHKDFWQQGSQGRTRVVIVVKYYAKDDNDQVKVEMEIWRTDQPVESISLFPDLAVPNPPKTLGNVGPSLPFPAGSPHLVMDDLYGGRSPQDVDGNTQLLLDIHFLRCRINEWAFGAGATLIP
ncbi:hypothetical protein BDN72DRAFT_834587 [Pluteus cervinus]|uniref:Uncharacterized protein n=1 Tax=Pluteus cervinus TaxID=181527 RepID=A0ACD3B700_9AGAR|nr:hypothetical protein BDN72DRAFT_834587 [Pluteus cervinus]